MLKKTVSLGGRTTKTITTFEMSENQGILVIDHRLALIIWKKGDYHFPNYIQVEAKEE